MKVIVNICRVLLGLVFIISGLIKANDPLGFSYKLDEYAEVFNMLWATKFTLAISIFACSMEVALGIALLIGTRIKLVSWLMLLLLMFFTFLTGYAAYTGTIKECGCFGDAIKFAPKQEVINDTIMLVMCLLIIAFSKYVKPLFKGGANDRALIIGTLASFAFTLYTYMYLPVKDFLPYKVGNNIQQQRQLPPNAKQSIIESVFIYKNKKTGQTKEVTEKSMMHMDTATMGDLGRNDTMLERKDKVIQEGDRPAITDFFVYDNTQKDITDSILKTKGYMLWIITQNAEEVSPATWQKMSTLIPDWDKLHIPVMCLAASSYSITETIRHNYNLAIPFYTLDFIVSKTMLRSNGGAILLKDGTVVKKWSSHALPDAATLQSIM